MVRALGGWVNRRCCGFALGLAIQLCTLSAYGYSYGSAITVDCHESITAEALRTVRGELETAQPLLSSDADEVLIEDMPVAIASDMQDIGAATLILGVRDNDLKGRQGLDANHLAKVHGDDDGQREHCLRRAEHDEAPLSGGLPFGSESALIECRGYIRELASRAIREGLGDDGAPDPSKRAMLDVTLAFSGRVNVPVPIFYLYLGQALHTLQDSFTHAFRTPDGMKVTVILNWVEFAHDRLKEWRDGPPHLVELDQCDERDRLRQLRRTLATQASTDLLRAALDPSLDADQKEKAVDDVLTRFMSFHAGCTFSNNWCDAEENALRPSGCNCELFRSQHAPVGLPMSLVLLIAGIGLVRRWQTPRNREESGESRETNGA